MVIILFITDENEQDDYDEELLGYYVPEMLGKRILKFIPFARLTASRL